MQINQPDFMTFSSRHQIIIKIKEALFKVGFGAPQVVEQEMFILNSNEGELRIPIEILVYIDFKPAILVKCINGSLTTRERASIAMARLFTVPPIPYAVVAHETDAVVMETMAGKTIGYGYNRLPGPKEVKARLDETINFALSAEQKEREKRIISTFYHIRCGGTSEPF